MNRFLCILFTYLTFSTLLPAYAELPSYKEDYETLSISNSFTIGNSETKKVSLDSVHYVKNLIIQAEGLTSDSIIEVMVNGEVKGTIYAPGRDPSYIVTIAETASSIEFRHRSGGSMRIINTFATISKWSRPNEFPHGGFYGSRDQVKELAQEALREIDFLQRIVTFEEYNEFLFPIKKSAGMVYVMSNAHGNLSKDTIRKLIALMDQIDFSRSYLNKIMISDDAFDSVVALLTVRETIEEVID